MQLTLNQIKKYCPCRQGWNTLLASLNKTHADDEPIHIMDILNSNGLDDAVWCLGCCDYKDYCLFLADVAESVLPYFEQYNTSQAPRQTIDAIRQYKRGEISRKQLKEFSDAEAKGVVTANASSTMMSSAVVARSTVIWASAVSVKAAANAVAFAITVNASPDNECKIETLFIKYFNKESSCN